MTYVMSGIYGDYDNFCKMLKIIEFSDKDVMYILGDIVDFGEKSMELIGDISVRYNVYTIVGDHDFTALRMLSKFESILAGESVTDEKFLSDMNDWFEKGGKPTLDSFKRLDADGKEGIIDYLSDMSLYEEVKVGKDNYLLVHAGIKDFCQDVDIDSLSPEDFFSEGLDFSKKYYDDKIIVTGHEPTVVENGGDGKIFYGNRSIDVDCGLMRGGTLGCLRLEDGKEFYV